MIAQHFTINAMVRDDDAPTFAMRLERALSIYDPAVTAAQLNLLDSHDTPRFLSMVSGDRSAVRLATLIQMTLPGAPLIYYGDEIGLAGELDPYNRSAFPWSADDGWDRDLLAYISGVVALRHGQPALRDGGFRVVAAESHFIAYLRDGASGSALVLVNAGDESYQLELVVPELDGRTMAAQRWPGNDSASFPDPLTVRDGRLGISLPARDGAVLMAI